jgi:hypothetical protein
MDFVCHTPEPSQLPMTSSSTISIQGCRLDVHQGHGWQQESACGIERTGLAVLANLPGGPRGNYCLVQNFKPSMSGQTSSV